MIISTKQKNRPALGQKLLIKGRAVRKRGKSPLNNIHKYRWWENQEIAETEAVYIGYRTLVDGIYVSGSNFIDEYEYDSPYLEPKETREAWLFVVSARKNPIYVFPNQTSFEGLEEVNS